jgi:hypothetical protein
MATDLALTLALLALRTTATSLALLTTLPALALRSLVLLLSARPRAWAFCPRASRVSTAAIDIARLLLGLWSRLLCWLLPRLWAARLHIGALIARSYAVCAWPRPRLVAAAFGAPLLRLRPTIAAFRTLPLLLSTISFLRSLPRLTATFGARALLWLIAVAVLGTLLPVLAPTSTRGPLALIGVAIAILSALTLVGVPVTLLRTLAIIGVAVAILGTSPLIGVAVAVLGTLPIVGVAVAILGTSPIVGVAIAVLGALLLIGVAALVWALLSARGARRIVAEAALLARTKRARRRHVPLRPDLGARLPNRRLRTEALTTQILLAHHDRTANPGCGGEHARLNLIGTQRPADRGRNVGCRDPGVHGKARPAIADDYGAIDHHGLAEEDRILTFRHDH